MAFPHRNTAFTTTSLFAPLLDALVAGFVLFMTVVGMVGLTQGLWQLCVHVHRHWWLLFQLPLYWIILVVWLLLCIVACFMVAIAGVVLGMARSAVKELFANDVAVE